jgi:N6-L-threonylcarbamoyladenine synthase
MPQSLIDQNIFNFSFSGMKSQVHQLLQKHPLETLSEQDICDICWEFQDCVTDILTQKLLQAAEKYSAKTIGIVG